MKKRTAFTLLELLVAIAIIGVLAAFIVSALSRVRRSGALVREVSAGRQMGAAYVAAAGDQNGQLMVGYSSSGKAVDDRGQVIGNPTNGRYPWRLAPYLQYKLQGSMLVNEQEYICKLKDHGDFVYRASLFPSFGINATYVGGNERMGLIPSPAMLRAFGPFVASRLQQVREPSRLILFASARSTGQDPHTGAQSNNVQAGFHIIAPPRTTQVDWQGKFDPKAPAENFGYLDLRHNDRAVCVMLGGNVELLDEKQLQDMRYWSPQAAEADEPDYLLKPIQ